MKAEIEMGITREEQAISKLKAIANAIHQLEGLPVDFSLAKQLSDVLQQIVRKYGY